MAKDFVVRFGRSPRRWLARMWQRARGLIVPEELEPGPPAGVWREERVESGEAQHLFRDILVPVTGAESGWRALTQAAEFARREGSVLRGLHVAASNDESALARGRQVLEEFTFRCRDLGIQATTSLAVGEVAQQIIERARWADMVVINQRREHGRWAERPLGTIFQTVAMQAARPIPAVPGTNVMPLRKALLAYDGSPKAREALFVLRHMIACWQIGGLLLAVEGGRANRETLEQAWHYLQETGGLLLPTRYETGNPIDLSVILSFPLPILGEGQG